MPFNLRYRVQEILKRLYSYLRGDDPFKNHAEMAIPLRRLPVPRWLRTELRESGIPALFIAWLILLFILLGYLVLTSAWWRSSGLAEKRLWDWLELLLLPAALIYALGEHARVTSASRAEKIELQRQVQVREACFQRLVELVQAGEIAGSDSHEPASQDDPAPVQTARLTVVSALRELALPQRQKVLTFLGDAHLAWLLHGAVLEKIDLAGQDLASAQLSECDLAMAHLAGANLSNAWLVGAWLANADLHEACLKDAHLGGAHLEGANLERAELFGTDLNHAVLQNCRLRRARMCQTILEGADLSYVDLLGADLRRASLENATLFQARLAGADLRQAGLTKTRLGFADLRGTDLRMAYLRQAELDHANMRRANLGPVEWVDLLAVSLDAHRVNLRETNLYHADLRGADLRAAILDGANLDCADLRGARLYREQLEHVASMQQVLLPGKFEGERS